MRRFELSDGVSNKFWEVELDDCSINVRFGKIGTAGQSQSKAHPDQAKAALALDKLVREKTGKGYVETGVSPSAPPIAAAPAKPKPALQPAPAPAAVPAPAPAPQWRRVGPAVAKPPAPIVHPGQTAPWLAAGPVIDMPAKLAALALPSRRFPGAPPPADADACWEQFLARARKHIVIEGTSGDLGYLAGVSEAGGRIADGVRKGSMLSDAVLLAVETAYEYYFTAADGTPFLDHLVASRGLEYACEIFALAQANVSYQSSCTRQSAQLTFHGNTERPLALRSRVGFCHTELALRGHLAHADQALWTRCANQLAAALPRLSLQRQPLLCVLLPELPELANTLARQHGSASAPDPITWLLMAVDRPALIAKVRRNKPHDWYTPLGFYNCPQALATIVQEHGVDAVPRLADGAIIEEAATALAGIGTPEALTELARASGHNKDCLLRFAEAARRWPLAAVAALSEVIAAAPGAGRSLNSILATHARDHAGALPAMKPWLSAPAGALLDKLAEDFGAPLDTADSADLPRVLASPPWKGKAKKAAAALALETLPLPPVERWTEGQREQILNRRSYSRDRIDEEAGDPLALARMIAFADKPYDKQAAAAIKAGDAEALLEVANAYAAAGLFRSISSYSLGLLPEPLVASFLSCRDVPGMHWDDYGTAAFGLKVLPGVCKQILESPIEELRKGLPFGAVELAAPMARAYTRLKKVRGIGRQWLLAFPEHAACGLLAPALGKAGEARDCAGAALRLLAGEGHEALLMAVAARYPQPQVAAAVRAMLGEDPLDLHPAKVGPLPPFWRAAGWSRPVLARNGKALPEDVLDHIGEMMRFPTAGGVYAGLPQLKQACTPESLADFAWDAFNAWIDSGAPSKESWVLTALGHIGNDDTARKLVPLLREWPSEGQSTRAVNGLEVLANIGTDTAVMLLNGIAQKAKSRPLQDAARERIEQIAEARDLSAEELADRITPDLGLDEQGTLVLDFGPRSFSVAFDEALKPYVRDQDGLRLPDLPKPKQGDDAELSGAAVDRFKRLKKDARTIATQQVQRLETAMCVRRRWEPQVFRTFLAGHPLVRNLVQRIVWGAYGADGKLLACFRVSQEGEWATSSDDAFELPAGDAIRIGIPHALEMDALDAAAFGQLFADYELLQPFTQIGRDTYALAAEDAAATALTRWAGITVRTKNVLGLASRGWRKGSPQSRGFIWNFTKDLGGGQALELTLDPGISAGMMDEHPEQKVTEVRAGKADSEGGVGVAAPMSSLHPVAASELVRDMEKLRA